jgi:hypothetical protein
MRKKGWRIEGRYQREENRGRKRRAGSNLEGGMRNAEKRMAVREQRTEGSAEFGRKKKG